MEPLSLDELELLDELMLLTLLDEFMLLTLLDELGALNELLDTGLLLPLPQPARSKAQQAIVKDIREKCIRLIIFITESVHLIVRQLTYSGSGCAPLRRHFAVHVDDKGRSFHQ